MGIWIEKSRRVNVCFHWKFVANPALQETSDELFRSLSRYYYAARPIQIMNPACLVYHDTPVRAPASMRAIYGDKGGFG